MELSQLRYFITVAKLGNISKAADALFVSQPNISTSISNLEQELQVPLFDRRRGKIVLNRNGELFLRSVERAFKALNEGIAAVHDQHYNDEKPLSIACMVDDSRLMREFLLTYPQMHIIHQRAGLDRITDLLRQQEIDVALTMLPPADDDIAFEKLYECRFVLVCNRKHPLAGRKDVSLQDMAKEHLTIDSSRTNPERFANAMRENGAPYAIDSYVEDSHILLSLIQANQCITHLPEAAYQELMLEKSYPSVTCVPLPPETPIAYWGIAYNKRSPLSGNAICFREFVRSYFPTVNREYAAQMERTAL